MILTAEISMYPLQDDYIPAIDAFIAALNGIHGLKVKTTPTCTLVTGDYDLLFNTLQTEIALCYHEFGRAVFVTKLIPDYQAL